MKICVVLLLFSIASQEVDADCSASVGPAGATECVLLEPYYSEYQWGTCLTDAYIRTFSKSKHQCTDNNATYCYYQCMMESYNIESGPVYDDCACVPGNVSTTSGPVTGSTTPSLPDWCFSPDGSSCNWYAECLENRHPCSSSSYGYAVSYALHFCNLYSKNQHMFLALSQRWINAVRKCLQVKLVPILRPYVESNCRNIQNFSFETHTPCYLHPYPGAPSVCDLDCEEWAKIFWTIKGAFVSATIESLKGMLSVWANCNRTTDPFSCGWAVGKAGGRFAMRIVNVVVKEVKHLIGKRSVSMDHNALAGSVADQLAKQLGWEKDGVQWFAFVQNDSNADEVGIRILLGSRALYDVNAVGVPTADMNKTVDDVADEIGNGQLYLDVGHNFHVSNFSACHDLDCQETYNEVIPKLKTSTSGAPFASKPYAITVAVCFICKIFLY